jgi:maltooligosyltrehalose trehalohydrolase
MLDLSTLGARTDTTAGSDRLALGIPLPGITAAKGYRLFADLIHASDQFDPDVAAVAVELSHDGGEYDHWTFAGGLSGLPGAAGRFGAPGRYLYRYRLERQGEVVVPFFADPFARASGTGTMSAFELPAAAPMRWTDADFRVPALDDLVCYELMVDDFARNFDGVRERLDYLKSLGVNCIELMPVTNVPDPYRWGYMPMSYFAIEERYGGVRKLTDLVDACHAEGVAVIHDAVYAHMHEEFAYRKVYAATGESNPMIGPFAGDSFGVGTDFRKPFAYDYFTAVNAYFIDTLHLDGFRYDYVPGFYDGPVGAGYSRLVFDTYQATKDNPRFQRPEGHNGIIQAAEYLDRPKAVLRETYTTASKRWWPMLKAQEMVRGAHGPVPEGLIHDLLLIDLHDPWPQRYENADAGDSFPVAPLQFIESHDKSRLMYLLSGEHSPYHGGFDLFGRDFSEWYRMQPLAIALMTCVGVPLLWQGQEFGETYGKHDDGGSRVLAARPLHWNYFYEPGGRALANLYRRLGQLRHELEALRSRAAWYHHDRSDPSRGLIAYQRCPGHGAEPTVVVLLNFGPADGAIQVPFPRPGRWIDRLDGTEAEGAFVIDLPPNETDVSVDVPSNYGRILVSDRG